MAEYIEREDAIGSLQFTDSMVVKVTFKKDCCDHRGTFASIYFSDMTEEEKKKWQKEINKVFDQWMEGRDKNGCVKIL